MIDEDSCALKYLNFGIFQDEIFNISPEFCKYISKFPAISYQLLLIKDNSPSMFKAISERVKKYDNLKDNLSEIEVLITFGARNVFELQDESIDINDFLECAYRNSNDFKSINVKYGNNYQERLQDKLKKEYSKANTNEKKLSIYMEKEYALSLNKAKKLLKDFGSDIENIEGLSEETKQFFYELEEVQEINNIEDIDNLFNSEKPKYSAIQVEKIKLEIQKACAIDFSKEFRSTDELIKEKIRKNEDVTEINYNNKKIKQVKLNDKFNILLHSTDTDFIYNKEKTEDFKEEWKKNFNKSNHIISTTYINQNFLGMAPVGKSGVRYAFSTVKNQNIKLMGVSDLNTYSSNFAYDAANKQYMTANTLTDNCRRVYSEFGIERENSVPDYVVLLDDDSPEVIENTYKAAMQFDIPILYMDKEEMVTQQINNLEKLLQEFKDTGDTHTLQQLLNLYETNVAGWLLNRNEEIEKDDSHTAGINNTRFKWKFENIQNKIETEVKQFLQSYNGNEQSEQDIVKVITILLNEIDLYEGCEKTKPISKTKINLRAKDLLQSANESLDKIGKDEFKIDIDKIPKRKEYELKIQQVVRNALCGENAVTLEDINSTKKLLERTRNDKTKENGRE